MINDKIHLKYKNTLSKGLNKKTFSSIDISLAFAFFIMQTYHISKPDFHFKEFNTHGKTKDSENN